ncbi:XRE family transcriptional regulator [bacterium]|nr:MAG: XRE family transcriptional regulator [bacterium]
MSKSVYSREYRIFLEQLRAAREASGLNQREVADKLGRSQSFVAKCEQGHNRVDVAQLVEFCRVLGVPLVRFMESYNAALEADESGN